MKKLLLSSLICLMAFTTFSQVSKNRLKTTNYGWINRVVPPASFLDSTFSSFWMPLGNAPTISRPLQGTTNNVEWSIISNNKRRIDIGATGINTIWGDSASFEIPLIVQGGGSVNGTNPYMQLKGYYIGAYRILNSTTGYEWYSQNQTIAGSDLDCYSIGISSNPSNGFLKIQKRGAFVHQAYYANTLGTKFQMDTLGHFGMGATAPVAASLRMSMEHGGGGTGTGIFLQGTINDQVTTAFRGVFIQPSYSTALSRGAYTGMSSSSPGIGSSTLASLVYYDSGTELANVTGNTYGYFSRITDNGSGLRWNFFSTGTAPSYFPKVAIGSATFIPSATLHIVGNTKNTIGTGQVLLSSYATNTPAIFMRTAGQYTSTTNYAFVKTATNLTINDTNRVNIAINDATQFRVTSSDIECLSRMKVGALSGAATTATLDISGNILSTGNSTLGGLVLSTGGVTISTKGINTSAGDAATINSPAGRFRKDTSGSSFTLTNDQITANSIIIITFASDPGITGYDAPVVTAGAGSATITFKTNGAASAPTADTDVNFYVIN